VSAFAPSSDTPVLPPILDSVLTNRGIMDRRSYFCSDWDAVPSPFSLSGLSDVVERIDSAIDNGDRIGIYGDYDCDGIAATAILRAALRLARCLPAIELPTRAHGYGLTADAVHRFSRTGIRLLIAVDNGISAHSAIRLAWRLGIDVIVIDHHSKVSDPAEAVVLWDPSFCGALLSLMVAWGLLERRDFHPLRKFLEGLNRVATIAAVADCIPLVGPVRLLTRLGLRAMRDTPHAGLRALLDAARIGDVVRASDLAWRVCPALNAPGRLSTPTLALLRKRFSNSTSPANKSSRGSSADSRPIQPAPPS
jgi:single-stranded-DNA-specific exonuclease